MNKKISHICPGIIEQLQRQTWVGNVRELENAVERAMVLAREPELRESDFIFKQASASFPEGKTLDNVERAHILHVLKECGGNQSRAAEILDIDRVTLHNKLRRYGWRRNVVETR